MPSTISSSVSSDFASSTVITPSLPTFCMASAIMSPTVLSPFAEIVPTCATSLEVLIFFDCFSRSLTTAATARSMPRFRSIGFMPAATYLAPSFTIAWASTVAVVVPSPAMSLVFDATSRTICAPMFSNLSSSSISLATVTPSLVMRGAPKDFSMHDVAALRSERNSDGIGQGFDAAQHLFARIGGESYVFRCHFLVPRVLKFRGLGSGGFPLRGGDALDDAHDVGLLHDRGALRRRS